MSAPEPVPGRPVPGSPDAEPAPPPFDPLRLCIYTTIALLAWILGPFAVIAFAVLGLAGYWKAHRAGLVRSRCALGDVRRVLAYLLVVAAVAVAGCVWQVLRLVG